jgi:hypothetical protein
MARSGQSSERLGRSTKASSFCEENGRKRRKKLLINVGKIHLKFVDKEGYPTGKIRPP